MNAGVALVRTYLHLNGYFTVSELPVVRHDSDGVYQEVTDVDMLALRFPYAAHIVVDGKPGPEDDLTFDIDPDLDVCPDAMDLIIGEVKEGRPRINDALRSPDTLYTALVRLGVCPEPVLGRVVDELRKRGESRLSADTAGIPSRIRLVAFGDGEGVGSGYSIVPMRRVREFVMSHLQRYRNVLQPVHHGDPVMGLLHLLDKLA